MTTFPALPGIRIRLENSNHHLWNNHGTWFIHYTIHPTSLTKQRIRHSLETKDIGAARRQRDAIFASLSAKTAKPNGPNRQVAAA